MAHRCSQEFSPVVVIPTFNNSRTLSNILSRTARLRTPIVVVNDGATDDTEQVLESWNARTGGPPAHVVTHRANLGKARALLTGFDAAKRLGHTHAVTMDSDGQLDPEEIPALLSVAQANPLALVLGTRDATRTDYPGRSRLGRVVSNLLICLESGRRVADSQCGFRVYPLRVVGALRCSAGHFGLETEIITRAAWAGCPIFEVPVTCRYFPKSERVSHFCLWKDTARCALMHGRLLLRAAAPWPHRALREEVETADRRSTLQRLQAWISPLRAWRELRESDLAGDRLALGVACGVFIGNLPLYGLHTLLGLYVAQRLRVNPAAVVTGTLISTPPFNVVLIGAAVVAGHSALNGELPRVSEFRATHGGFGHVAERALGDWVLGSLIVGAVLALATYLLARRSFRLLSSRSRRGVPAAQIALPDSK